MAAFDTDRINLDRFDGDFIKSWEYWSVCFKLTLGARGLMDALEQTLYHQHFADDPTQPPANRALSHRIGILAGQPGALTDEEKAAHRTFVRTDMAALYALIRHISPDLFREFSAQATHAYTLWTALSTRYVRFRNSTLTTSAVSRDFSTLSMRIDETVSSFFRRAHRIFSDYEHVNVTTLTQEAKQAQVKNALPVHADARWSNFTASLHARSFTDLADLEVALDSFQRATWPELFNSATASNSAAASSAIYYTETGKDEERDTKGKKLKFKKNKKGDKPKVNADLCLRCGNAKHGKGQKCPIPKERLHCGFCNTSGHVTSVCIKRQKQAATAFETNTVATPLHLRGSGYHLVGVPAVTTSTALSAEPANNGNAANMTSSAGSQQVQRADFIIDSGASHHACNDRGLITEFAQNRMQMTMTVANSEQLHCDTFGAVPINKDIVLLDVAYHPKFAANLLSVPRLTAKGVNVLFTRDHAFILPSPFALPKDSILLGERHGEQYKVPVESIPTQPSSQAPQHSSSAIRAVDIASALALNHKALDLWHRRLGHVHHDAITRMIDAGAAAGLDGIKTAEARGIRCEDCALGKIRRHDRAKEMARPKANSVMERVHCDFVGPINVPSLDGHRYASLIVDEFTDGLWVRCIKLKSEVANHVVEFCEYARNRFGRYPVILHSDDDAIYCSKELTVFFSARGIQHTASPPYSPHENEVVERRGYTLFDAARTLLIAARLPAYMWPHAIRCLAYLYIRCTRTIHRVTAYEKLYGCKPTLNHLRVFGCDAIMHIPEQRRGPASKLKPRGIKVIFIGYDEVHSDWLFFDPSTRKTFNGRDARFAEDNFTYGRSDELLSTNSAATLEIVDEHDGADLGPAPPSQVLPAQGGTSQIVALTPPITAVSAQQSQPIIHVARPPLSAPAHAAIDDAPPEASTHAEDTLPVVPAPSQPQIQPQVGAASPLRAEYRGHIEVRGRPPTRFRVKLNRPLSSLRDDIRNEHKDDRIEEEVDEAGAHYAHSNAEHLDHFIGNAYSITLEWPNTFEEAMRRPDAAKWKAAADEEVEAHGVNKTWIWVPTPKSARVLPSRWRFTTKKAFDEETKEWNLRYKARFCTKGFAQREGIDYGETFAPVARYSTLKCVLTISSSRGYLLFSLDVKTAFLNAEIDCEIYVTPPPGYERNGKVLKLLKALYGLKQAPKLWYDRFDQFMINTLRFKRLVSDRCIYIRNGIIIVLYVDDIVSAVPPDQSATWLEIKSAIMKEFPSRDNGELKYILGFRVSRLPERHCILLDQVDYIEKLVQRYQPDAETMRAINVPLVNRPTTSECAVTATDKARMEDLPFRALIGALYYAVHTRPDVNFAVSALAQFNANPGPAHYEHALRVVRYLHSTRNLALRLGGAPNAGFSRIVAYADADWGGDNDTRRSTTGVLVQLDGGVIFHNSVRQRTVARSSMEAEYVSMADCTAEIIWQLQLFKELSVEIERPVIIYCDNQSALALADHDTKHSRTKHIDIQYHFIRERIHDGTIRALWIESTTMLADILTKPLQAGPLARIRNNLLEQVQDQ